MRVFVQKGLYIVQAWESRVKDVPIDSDEHGLDILLAYKDVEESVQVVGTNDEWRTLCQRILDECVGRES